MYSRLSVWEKVAGDGGDGEGEGRGGKEKYPSVLTYRKKRGRILAKSNIMINI